MRAVLHVFCALMMGAGPARAEAAYDPPISVTNIDAPPDPAAETGAVRCTVYGDLIAWETDTNTPGPTLSLIMPTGSLPPCGATRPPGQLVFRNSGGLVGRRGPFLLVHVDEGPGYETFSVVTTSGKVLYTDNMPPNAFPVSTLENGAMRLRFTRAVPAHCSLMTNSPACWAQLLHKGDLPRVLAAPVPSAAVCMQTYLRQNAPPDDPSIITYDVDMMISSAGQRQVLSRGRIGCLPMS